MRVTEKIQEGFQHFSYKWDNLLTMTLLETAEWERNSWERMEGMAQN